MALKRFAATLALALLLSLALVPASRESAWAEPYVIDPARSKVTIRTGLLYFWELEAQFQAFSGSFDFEADDQTARDITLTIDTTSIRAEGETEEAQLRSPRYLNVEKYPTMRFVGTGIEKTGERTSRLTGDFTMIGVTRPIELAVTYLAPTDSPPGDPPELGAELATFDLVGILERSAFGMTYNIPAVSDEITIELQIVGVRQ